MDPIQITCKIAEKLGQSRGGAERISRGVYKDFTYTDEEYAERTSAYKRVIALDGLPSYLSVPVLDIVKMVLEIQQEEYNKLEFKEFND